MEIKNIGQLLQHLATKAGIQPDDKNLVNLLSNAELTKISIHSDLIKQIDENLLSVDAASDNHPTIGAKYKAQALNAFDKKMQAMMDEFELDDETKNELLGIQSSFKRFENLAAKIKELNAAKVSATGKGDKDALQKQIDDLQKQLKAATESLTTKDTEFTQKLASAKIDFALREKLGGKKTIFDQLTPDIRHTSLITVINKALQDKDAQLSYDEKGNLQLLKSDGSKLYGANHTLIGLDDLIDSTLAQEKILVVSQQQQQQQSQQQQQNGIVVPGGGAAISGTNQSIIDFNKAQREAFQSADA